MYIKCSFAVGIDYDVITSMKSGTYEMDGCDWISFGNESFFLTFKTRID